MRIDYDMVKLLPPDDGEDEPEDGTFAEPMDEEATDDS